ncbi:carbon-nitrogen hydrolase family protein [Halosolutus halophilus]|uniref:carbon-nitrogen hydrolase family protein n=1 Tax=Halosolutus halophilus TaxID=1552990 RepID=UPI002234F766|nr:carbon-nitrogen hydrolase family protein [Halosolutus halophilus]
MPDPDAPAVAACQFEPTVGDVDANVERIEQLLGSLPDSVELAVFPELCVTGYDVDVAEVHAAEIPGRLTDRLIEVADSHGTTLVVGLPERDGNALYNDLVCVTGDGVTATYRKQYLWGDEADRFATGSAPVTVETTVGTVGFVLCYDLNFPEVTLAYGRAECDLLAVSAAWRESYRSDWRLLCRARGFDGTCYVVGANHAGDQRGRVHAGGSLVAGPEGDILVETGDGKTTVAASFDRGRIATARERNPVLETRRARET